jgi:hypothetical protein
LSYHSSVSGGICASYGQASSWQMLAKSYNQPDFFVLQLRSFANDQPSKIIKKWLISFEYFMAWMEWPCADILKIILNFTKKFLKTSKNCIWNLNKNLEIFRKSVLRNILKKIQFLNNHPLTWWINITKNKSFDIFPLIQIPTLCYRSRLL